MKFVTDEPGQFQDRAALARRAQERFIDEPFLIERQNIRDHCCGVEQGDGKIVVRAGAQILRRRQCRAGKLGEHAAFELPVGADTITDRR